MGTRGTTIVYDENNTPLVSMYRQFDSYPEGHGIDLAKFLSSFAAITNGYTFNEKRKIANGMGCLAAQLIGEFKHGHGGIYIVPHGDDCGEDYFYHVYNNRVVVVGYSRQLFDGSWSEFNAWCNKPDYDFTTKEGQAELRKMLHNGNVEVTFTKADGTERTMICTLKSDVIGDYAFSGAKAKTPNPDVCKVFDVEAEGWRSFRWDSIISVTVTVS